MSAKKVAPTSESLWLHVRILYVISCVIIVGVSLATWTIFLEVEKLRKDFHGEIVRKGVVDFSDLGRRRSDVVGGAYSEVEEEEEEQVPEEEQLLRVKRQSSPIDEEIKGNQPAYYHHTEGSGGSDEYVWLTSYARIPVRHTFLLTALRW
jgi:hypothetical protein